MAMGLSAALAAGRMGKAASKRSTVRRREIFMCVLVPLKERREYSRGKKRPRYESGRATRQRHGLQEKNNPTKKKQPRTLNTEGCGTRPRLTRQAMTGQKSKRGPST